MLLPTTGHPPAALPCRFEVSRSAWQLGYASGDEFGMAFDRTHPVGHCGWKTTAHSRRNCTNTATIENVVDITEDPYRVAKIRGWTLNSTSDVIETTSLGDTLQNICTFSHFQRRHCNAFVLRARQWV
jgi:hypothetical protein